MAALPAQPAGGFDFDPRTRVVFGPGVIARLGELVRDLGGPRVLLVTDPGIKAAGHADRALALLESAGCRVSMFSDVHPNPTTDDVGRGLAVAQAAGIEQIVAVGGGSSLDCAKGINFLLTNGGRMQDYWGVGKARLPMLPLTAVPTTAGTGSEAQSFALISDAVTHQKMACGDKKAHCRLAILDPELTVSMPASVTAATGIDAISHALESFVSTRRNSLSQLFSLEAWQRLDRGLGRLIRNPSDVEARGEMLWGAHLAGAAIENSMLGAAHALANPLTAQFDVTHGLAIGIMLPHVIRWNAVAVPELYQRLAAASAVPHADANSAGEQLARRVAGYVQAVGAPTSLAAVSVPESAIESLAEDAARQWTGGFNPRPVDVRSLRELYQCALNSVG